MAARQRLWVPVALAAALLVLAALPAPGGAKGAVGVESVSRPAGTPGERVELTIGCGFCYPPCRGTPGHRNAPCMMGTDDPPPPAFPVSLVPAARAPDPTACGGFPGCPPAHAGPPVVAAAPRRAPYTYLGRAVPPAGIEAIRESGRSYVPRYYLDFEIPPRRPGVYALVIFCDACWPGRGGALISQPRLPYWRVRIDPAIATFSPVRDWFRSIFA